MMFDLLMSGGCSDDVTHTGAVGVALMTCGIPETGAATLGGRFLLVTDAQENGCEVTTQEAFRSDTLTTGGSEGEELQSP